PRRGPRLAAGSLDCHRRRGRLHARRAWHCRKPSRCPRRVVAPAERSCPPRGDGGGVGHRDLGGRAGRGARRDEGSGVDRHRRGRRNADRVLRQPAHVAVGARALPCVPGPRCPEAVWDQSSPGSARGLRRGRGRPARRPLRESPRSAPPRRLTPVLTAELVTVSADPAGMGADAALAVGRLLEREGCPVRARRVVPDEEEAVERALREAAAAGGFVVAVGEADGAGTLRQALARCLESRLVLSSRALDALTSAYAARGQALPGRAEQMALVPQGAAVVTLAEPAEPGLPAGMGTAASLLAPAAPPGAVALARAHVLLRLEGAGAGPVVLVRTLRLVGPDVATAEAQLQAALRGADGVSGHVIEGGEESRARLRLRADSRAGAEAAFGALEPALREAFGAAWYGVDDETLEVTVGRLLRARHLTVALAESCTGGLVGHRLTQVAGSSAYFERGFVVYSNEAKQALLGVPEAVLRQHGAVSAACAESMAQGARERAGTDVGVSVTGIAGPEGGTPTKPVGTVFIGLADPQGVVVERHRFDRDREGNKALSAVHALDLLRRRCLGVI